MSRQPTDEEIENRLAGRELMEREARKGDRLALMAIHIESLHPYMKTMLDYRKVERDEEGD